MAEEQKEKPEKTQTKEERLERIRRLLAERGKDAAAVVKMWMQEEAGKQRQK